MRPLEVKRELALDHNPHITHRRRQVFLRIPMHIMPGRRTDTRSIHITTEDRHLAITAGMRPTPPLTKLMLRPRLPLPRGQRYRNTGLLRRGQE